MCILCILKTLENYLCMSFFYFILLPFKLRKLQFLSRGNLKKEHTAFEDPTSVVVVVVIVACSAYKFPTHAHSEEELKLHPMEVKRALCGDLWRMINVEL